MKPIVISILLLLGCKVNLLAQQAATIKTIVSGSVIEASTGQPISFASISVRRLGKDSIITATTSEMNGHFSFVLPSKGSYIVRAEHVGFELVDQPYEATVTDKAESGLNISLRKKATSLQEVTVIAAKPPIENKIDRIVYNAEKDLTSQGGVATDLLKKIPQVSVDVDGNVELAGSGSVRFLINGKPSTAFGSNIADVLQSIPASQIKSIEVMTNPGARYDAQGLGGIINIILKDNKAKGMNGNLSLTGGSRLQNGSFNFNARAGNFGVNAFVSGNTRLPSTVRNSADRTSFDSLQKDTVLLHQSGSSRFHRHGIETGIGIDWKTDKKSTLTGNIGYNQFGNNSDGHTDQVEHLLGGSVQSSPIFSTNQTSNRFRFHSTEASINYKRTFAEDNEFEVNINSSFGKSSVVAKNEQFSTDSLTFGTHNLNNGKDNEVDIQVDRSLPLNKNFSLGFGGKAIFQSIQSTSQTEASQGQNKQYVADSALSNSLNYHQQVYAGYLEGNWSLPKIIDIKAGLRYERTVLNTSFSNVHSPVETPAYNTWAPSVFFSKKLGERHLLKLSYARRIERPEYFDLNPFINTSDPKNFTTGNPYLRPEIANRIELAYQLNFEKVGALTLALFHRTSNHDIQPYVTYYPNLVIGDTTYTNVSLSTRENIGLEKNTGFSVFSDLQLSEKLNVRTNLFAFYRHITNALDAGYNAHSVNYRVNLNITYRFSGTLAAEAFGNFNSPRNEVQGKYPSFTSYNLALRKQILKKKGSLAFVAVNPFNEYVVQKTQLFGPGFTSESERKIPFRSFGINFTWKFGKLEFKKENVEAAEPSVDPS